MEVMIDWYSGNGFGVLFGCSIVLEKRSTRLPLWSFRISVDNIFYTFFIEFLETLARLNSYNLLNFSVLNPRHRKVRGLKRSPYDVFSVSLRMKYFGHSAGRNRFFV